MRTCDSLEAAPAPGKVDGPLDPDPAVAAAQQWRADNGLRSDADWVRQVATTPTTTPEAGGWAHPLTDAEFESMQSEEETRERNRIVYDYAVAHPESFAGMWHDARLTSKTVFVAFTSRLEDHRAELARRLGSSFASVRVVNARWALTELEALKDRLMDTFAEHLSGVDAEEELNVVEVMLPERDAAIEQQLVDAAGAERLCVSVRQFVAL